MPKTVKEIIADIEADGRRLNRQKGSHRQFKHPTKSGTVTVAGHPSDVPPPGTAANIRRQAGLR